MMTSEDLSLTIVGSIAIVCYFLYRVVDRICEFREDQDDPYEPYCDEPETFSYTYSFMPQSGVDYLTITTTSNEPPLSVTDSQGSTFCSTPPLDKTKEP
jgi:hypothetical protein